MELLNLVSGSIFLHKVLFLLEIIFLPALIEQSPLEWLAWIEVTLLSCHSLLVLEHLLVDLFDESQFVHIDLYLILEIF